MLRYASPSVEGLVVAIDGPASSGKSSVGAAAATALGYRFCDTGLLYRAVTWLSIERGIDPDDPDRTAELVALVAEVELAEDDRRRLDRVIVDGIDRSADVRTAIVDARVSAVSRVAKLRAALLERQRALARDGAIIMAGRDIGTVVLPDADLKVFLDASAEERARRRAIERGIDPSGPEAAEILDQLRRRDHVDSTRSVAPLAAAADAIHVATDGKTFEETIEAVVAVVRALERPDGEGAR